MEITDNIHSEYQKNNSWGIATNVDLHECNPDFIRDAEKIKTFVVELCDLIGAKRFGECIIVHFGEREDIQGFSMAQLIESSLVSGHFANKTNNVYLDIFSCKYYNPKEVAEFAKNFFEASDYNLNHVLRK
jgi:S-adenosylmethionine decarboxylase